jgi:hypothetical protein
MSKGLTLNVKMITRKRPLQSPTRKWEENIRMDVKEMFDSVQDRHYWRALFILQLSLRVS